MSHLNLQLNLPISHPLCPTESLDGQLHLWSPKFHPDHTPPLSSGAAVRTSMRE